MQRLSLSYGFISCVYVHGLVLNNIHTKAKVNGVTLDAGVMTGSCLLFRNGVKLQLNIDTVVSYERYLQTFLALLHHQILIRLCYSPLSGVTSMSEVTPT